MQANPVNGKTHHADVIVCGGGPAGLTLSSLLAGAGLDVVLIDAEPPRAFDLDRPSGRTAALLNGSINVLKTCGVWDLLSAPVTPLKTMRIVDDQDTTGTRAQVEFSASDLNAEQFGYNVPNEALRAALGAQVSSLPNLVHLCPARLSSYEILGAKVCAETEDGLKIHAGLIVGTDGRNSMVRKIAGIDAQTRSYDQTAITCFVTHSKPHEYASTEFHRPGGPFTFVPMPGQSSSVVWVEKTEDAKKFLSMKKQEFQQALQDRSQGLLGVIALASTPESWPLIYLYADDILAPRAVLAAEAAHVLSPLGAQGLNLSIRDVAILAETIVDAARLGEDIGSAQVLARYKQRRKTDMDIRVHGIDRYNLAVASDSAAIRRIKTLGLSTLEKIPTLKDFAMRKGLSPSMDGSSRLLSGHAL